MFEKLLPLTKRLNVEHQFCKYIFHKPVSKTLICIYIKKKDFFFFWTNKCIQGQMNIYSSVTLTAAQDNLKAPTHEVKSILLEQQIMKQIKTRHDHSKLFQSYSPSNLL